jgi:hypothetical protein
MSNERGLVDMQRETVRALEDGRRVLAAVQGSRVARGQRSAIPECVRPLADAVADPARFWGLAASGALGGQSVIASGAAEMTAAAIRAAAARLAVGDYGPAREALVGQAAWLGATAIRLMALSAEVEPGPRAGESQAELVKLALRASDQAAKAMASAAALNAIGGAGGDGVTVVE